MFKICRNLPEVNTKTATTSRVKLNINIATLNGQDVHGLEFRHLKTFENKQQKSFAQFLLLIAQKIGLVFAWVPLRNRVRQLVKFEVQLKSNTKESIHPCYFKSINHCSALFNQKNLVGSAFLKHLVGS